MNGKGPMTRKQGWAVILAAGMALASLPDTAALAQTGHKQAMVQRVEVVGNRRVPTEKILNTVGTRVNKEYSQATAEEDARKLMEMGTFRNVESKCYPS